MSHVQQLIQNLRRRIDLSVEEQKDAWLVLIPKDPAGICTVTVPRDRFEWFADVKRDGKEVWSDWMDHYGSPDAKLDAEMAESIAAFIERVTHSGLELPLKIYEQKT